MSNRFYEVDKNDLNFIPFDIETTGFKAADGDFVTNVVLHHNDLYHIWINTDGEEVSAREIQDEVEDGSELDNIVLYVCESEREMLLNIGDYLDEHAGKNAVLTAFNGETYSGRTDFDVPFLRTRCFRNGVPWILDGYWYTDTYEVFSQKSRFDTTVKAEPSLDDMKKTDVQQFVDDMGFDIHYEEMLKTELVNEIETSSSVTTEMLRSWAEDNDVAGVNPEKPGSFRKGQLQNFVDDMSIDIPYDNLSADELIREIRENGFEEDMLIEWHEMTGRSIGTTEVTTLDGIHEVVIEDRLHGAEWRRGLPFDVEVFEPFDPYVSSGEAVTGYMNGDYAGVILHCFADVARTVNITRAMREYAPKKDYQPKVL